MLSNVVKFIPQIFEAIDGLKAELCLVKFEKSDACIRPLFANPATYIHPTLIYKSSIHGFYTHNIIEALCLVNNVQLLNSLYIENEMNNLHNLA